MFRFKRSERVGELIHQEVSKIVQELKEPGIGFITITDLDLTDDLKIAKIYYSVLGSEKEIEFTRRIMENSISHIRHELAIRLNLKRTPEIKLEYDITPVRAARIFDILETIKKEDNEIKSNNHPDNHEKKSSRKISSKSKKK